MEKIKIILGIILGILLSVCFLFAKDYLNNSSAKLYYLRRDLINNYYDKDKLRDVLKQNLGKNYTDNLEEDFDNFVITMVLRELSELEHDKNKKYNSFFPKEKLMKFDESGENLGNQTDCRPMDENIYYIGIKEFTDNITFDKIQSKITEIEKFSKVIIDLRDNSGGSFKELRKIAGIFLNKGDTIYNLNYGENRTTVISNKSRLLKFEKIVVLMNNNTASVSELMIAALKHNMDNVTTIGTNSLGKNVSYSLRRFKDKSGMIFISSLMEGPDSKVLDITGIEPDIEVGNLNSFYEQIIDENERRRVKNGDSENQLNRALEVLYENIE